MTTVGLLVVSSRPLRGWCEDDFRAAGGLDQDDFRVPGGLEKTTSGSPVVLRRRLQGHWRSCEDDFRVLDDDILLSDPAAATDCTGRE